MKDQLNNYALEMKQEAYNIFDFWIKNTIDTKNGGFIGSIDLDMTKHPESEKGAVLNARILWSFSSGYRIFKEPKYLEMANREYDYLKTYFVDKEKGGIYWMLNADGSPANTRKQIYAIAFAMYGLVEYYKITSNKEALDLAVNLFELIEKYSFDPVQNGYFEAYSKDWVLLEDLRLSEKDANEKKTMNTHLHILEAYTNLYRVYKEEKLQKALKNLIEVFLDKIIDQEKGFFNLFFDENWTHKSQENSYGHDIEGSWLLWEAAEVLGDKATLEKCRPVCIAMAEQAYRDGLDKEDFGLMSDGLFGKLTDTDKHWWPQAESVIGFFNAWQLTNDSKFLEASQKCWDFTKKYIIDHENGEWFWRVSKDHVLYKEEQKTGPWKCPYHNSRMCMEIFERINK